jgi:hypothetical protein
MSNFAIEARKPHGHQGRTGTQAQASDQKNKPHVVLLPMTGVSLTHRCDGSSQNQE